MSLRRKARRRRARELTPHAELIAALRQVPDMEAWTAFREFKLDPDNAPPFQADLAAKWRRHRNALKQLRKTWR